MQTPDRIGALARGQAAPRVDSERSDARAEMRAGPGDPRRPALFLAKPASPPWRSVRGRTRAPSKLRTGKPPTILRAIRCDPRAPQQDLTPLAIAGNPDYTVDPYADDFYIHLIDLRTQIKRQAQAAEQAGDIALAARLD